MRISKNMAIWLVVGLVLVGLGVFLCYQRYLSASWPSTDGKVLESKVVSHRRGGSKPRVKYKSHVVYEYVVDGRRYESDRIAISLINVGGRRGAAKRVERYVVGSDIVVYYNPDNPFEAVIERGAVWSPLVISGLGVILILWTMAESAGRGLPRPPKNSNNM